MFTSAALKAFTFLFLFQQIQCYNILGVFNIPSKSLHLAGTSLMRILQEKGHNVTLVTSFKSDVKMENFTHVYLEDTARKFEQMNINFFDFEMNPYMAYYGVELMGIDNCNSTFHDPAFKRLLKSDTKFDLLIVDPYMSTSLMYLPEYYKVPVIIYSCFDSSYNINSFVGNPSPPSYIPDVLLQYPSEMTFFQRLDNSLIFLINEFVRNFYSIPNHDKIIKDLFPGAPDISEYYYKSSVVLVNGDVSIMDAMPKTPGMFHIGGFHIAKPNPLPGDLKKIMDNAKHGVILFSLGSNVKSSQLPKATVQKILQVFSNLQETVIWKWEDEDLPGRPSNVIVRKWLPQTDLLAHKNMKLFITHGGLHSILETVHYGIPCVCISVFLDQAANSQRAARLGFAEWIKYEDFTAEKFENALRKTLNDDSYRQVVKARSKIMLDKPMTPQETVTFWVEYVIRHKGAKHLQVAAVKLYWYQYILLDVVLFAAACLIISILLIKFAIRFFICKFFERNSNVNKIKKS